MTYTKDDETGITGLSVVLKSAKHSTQSIPLTDWLSDQETSPVWIPLSQQNGVTKVMPVSKPQTYPSLMQFIYQQIGWNTMIEWQGKTYELTGIEVSTHDLCVLQIPISPAEPLPPSMGRAVHAQFFQWIATADAALAELLHQQSNLPVTLSLNPGSHPKLKGQHASSLKSGDPPTRLAPEEAPAAALSKLKISLLQRELLAPLLLGLSQDLGTEIHLGGITCRLGHSIDIMQTNRFEQLVQIPPQEVIELKFLSPTSFKQGQNIQPFPLPEMVFSSLLRRWNTFAPENLQFPKVEWQGLVAMYELRTKTFRMEGGAEIGTVGWVRYRFPNSEQARIATILAHFASFSGVGRKTAMGMGQAQIIN